MKTTMRYYVLDHGDINDTYEFETHHEKTELRWTAEDAAMDYHSNHDGYECDWPLTVVLVRDGEELGRFHVESKTVPQFTAMEVKRARHYVFEKGPFTTPGANEIYMSKEWEFTSDLEAIKHAHEIGADYVWKTDEIKGPGEAVMNPTEVWRRP